MTGDLHEQTDELFALLAGDCDDKNARALLAGMNRLGILLEELGFGLQQQSGEILSSLAGLNRRLEELRN